MKWAKTRRNEGNIDADQLSRDSLLPYSIKRTVHLEKETLSMYHKLNEIEKF